MRVWLIGADQIGSCALRQLRKNPDIEVVVSDPSPRPFAVEQGLIDRVDHVENVTPVNINQLARRILPDIILLSPSAGGDSLGLMEGGGALKEALNYEIAVNSEYPCLVLSDSFMA